MSKLMSNNVILLRFRILWIPLALILTAPAGAADYKFDGSMPRPVLESYLMERALHRLNVPSELLIFPGEGHSLDKNPWHGKIKVQQELKWLEKYGGVSASNP